MRTLLVFSTCLCLTCACSATRASEFFSGDQVVFTGGPSRPPESRDTGVKMGVDLRGGSPVRAGGRRTARPGRPGDDKPPRPLHIGPVRERSLYRLAERALHDPSPDARASALVALSGVPGVKRDREAMRALRESIYDRDYRMIALGASLLGKMKDRESVPGLVRLIAHEKRFVERAAIRALGDIGDALALPDLERRAESGIPGISPLARKAVEQIRSGDRKGDDGAKGTPECGTGGRPAGCRGTGNHGTTVSTGWRRGTGDPAGAGGTVPIRNQ